MNIKLIKELRAQPEIIDIDRGTPIRTIADKYQGELNYRILAARVDNMTVDLNETLEKEVTVEFLDMRDIATNLIYQHSLSLIYLKAISDVLGKVGVDIKNSLNKGLYTVIKTLKPLSDEDIVSIENRMKEIVEQNIPFVKEVVTREQALQTFVEDGHVGKSRLLMGAEEQSHYIFYSLNGYRNFFYGLMVPSTGYIEHFELRKYRAGVLLRFPHPSQPNVIPEYIDEEKMYSAFSEANRWGDLMGVSSLADLNEKVYNGEYKELIQLSEALHEKKITEIADMIKAEKRRLILIAGPSSSGKTTFAKRLCIQLKVNGLNPLYMGTDDYFVERPDTPIDEHGDPDYENLGAMDIGLFNANMSALLAGETVDLPTFDFLTGHKMYGKRITKIGKNQPIVIEGIHALNEAMTPGFDRNEKFKIYISPLTQITIDDHNRIPTTDARMLRRLVRDNLYRGHSAASTISSWSKVRAGEDKNIFPYNGEADVFFNSVHLYELAVLKKYAEPLLEGITPMEREYAEATRLLKFLHFFLPIEDDAIIVNNSILREFIGGSIFV